MVTAMFHTEKRAHKNCKSLGTLADVSDISEKYQSTQNPMQKDNIKGQKHQLTL